MSLTPAQQGFRQHCRQQLILCSAQAVPALPTSRLICLVYNQHSSKPHDSRRARPDLQLLSVPHAAAATMTEVCTKFELTPPFLQHDDSRPCLGSSFISRKVAIKRDFLHCGTWRTKACRQCRLVRLLHCWFAPDRDVPPGLKPYRAYEHQRGLPVMLVIVP